METLHASYTSKLRLQIILLASITLIACAPVNRPNQITINPRPPVPTGSPTQIVSPKQVENKMGEHVLSGEKAAVELSMENITKQGYKMLSCRYYGELGTTQTTDYVYYWYEKVGALQQNLVYISPGHPLAALGDTPRTTCPATRAEAKASIDKMAVNFRRHVYALTNYGWRTPVDPKAPEPVNCVKFIQDKTIQNQCSFPVIFKWCTQRDERPCIPRWQDYLSTGFTHRFNVHNIPIFNSVAGMAIMACPVPYVPTLPERYNWQTPNSLPWRCQMKKQP